MAALNRPLLSEAVPLIRREIFPSIYKRNLREGKYVENISMQVERNLQNVIGSTK